ncbi:MAG: DUF930 domain-containing protein [Rhizobiales bacterium]|nr:DUF930 domain-containing protein [Hyphomicrobiales bacterium]OJY06786.1 MAG: hypothetical protein BGP07_17340 [Rhizobiales bacterium 63-22]
MKYMSVPLSFFACVLPLALASLPAAAMNRSEKKQLEKLDPATRLEQRCDVEAMERITREERRYSVDKVLAYAFADPVAQGNSLRADGAAFRSREHWYKLAYDCNTDDEHVRILSFRYRIGDEVPKNEWDQHYLVP